jgi:Domain of unknown function (DUF1844)
MENAEKNQMMFVQLVAMFQTAALQQMGKIKSPASDAIEKNMEQAQLSIDLIDMLKEKTKGNRSPEEDRFISGVLQDLKLNYVDELAKETPAPEAKNEAAQ